jgi:hypothetical protein
MQSNPIQEFRINVRGYVLGPGLATNNVISQLNFESPRLTTRYEKEGLPAGSDRSIARTVNGFLQINFKDKSVYDPANFISVRACLMGEYAGISAVIGAPITVDLYDPVALATYQSNGGIGFTQFSSFSNLAQNVYIRAVLFQRGLAENPASVAVDAVFSGALLAFV